MARRPTVHGYIEFSSDGKYATKVSAFRQPDRDTTTDDPVQEITWLAKIDHPHILPLHGFTIDHKLQKVRAIFEKAPYGDLMDLLLSRKDALPLQVTIVFMKQVLSALEYLHDKKQISHMDVSLENILIFGLTTQVKLCDFGCAVESSKGESKDRPQHPGKTRYRAPEYFRHPLVYDTQAADIYSFGICLHICLLGAMPFDVAHESDNRFKCFKKRGIRGLLKACHRDKSLSEEAFQVLEACLQVDPARRASAKKILAMQFFA